MIEAVISHDNPRAQDWIEVFGTNRAPVVSPFVRLAELPGGNVRACYFVEVERLAPDVIERLVAFAARRFGGTADDHRRELAERKLFPLVADDVSIVIDPRFVL